LRKNNLAAKSGKKAAAARKRAKSKKNGLDAALRRQLVALLKGGEAHVGLLAAMADFPAALQGRTAEGFPHTAWQLVEHIRIAQWDIVEFSRDPQHVSPDFPGGYWPSAAAPPDPEAWGKSVAAVKNDLEAMIRLVENRRVALEPPFPWGKGQNLLREALLAADHNAYHLGQLVALRKALGIWQS
jgi:DinB family protein